MNLGDSILRPGEVLEIVTNYGVIKASSPGFFPHDSDPALLPPILPLLQPHSGYFSSPVVGDSIWILHDLSNSQLFFYLRHSDLPKRVMDILSNEDENIEVVFSRDTDKGIYQLFFSDGTGIRISKDNSIICIDPDGNIDMYTDDSNRAISISPDSVCIGARSEDAGKIHTHAAYGEKVEECLEMIGNILSNLRTTAMGNPYTAHLSTALASVNMLSNKVKTVTSKDVKIV